MNGIVRPDFAGGCLTNVVPGLIGGDTRPGWFPPPAREAEIVVLFVIDGLGWADLEKHREHLPNLAAMEGGPITSVIPSTTSTVLTSITTGAAPAQHGLLGMRMFMGDTTLNVLHWFVSPDGQRPDPARVQPVKPFGGKPMPVVSRSHFKKTGFSEAHMRGTRYFGWFTTSTLVERCRLLARAGEPFVYTYYDGVDHVAHVRGLNDSFFDAELVFTDRLVGDLLDALPASAALLVTADHGQEELPADAWIQLGDDILALVEHHAGDARFRYLHARAGAAGDLLAAARERFGAQAWVLSRDEVLADGLLGVKPPTDEVAARFGDVVLAARDAVAFMDPAFPEEVRLKAAHGSMTEREMMVPLVAARGRAR